MQLTSFTASLYDRDLKDLKVSLTKPPQWIVEWTPYWDQHVFISPPRVPWLYRAIHQMHHQHHVPFALAAQDASSAELLSLLLLALGSAWMLGCHPLSEALFHFLNSWLAVEDHCGYNLPWALHRLLPCMGGAPFHQTHHKKQRNNFAPYFTHWDHLFGTYIAPQSHFRKRHDRTVMKWTVNLLYTCLWVCVCVCGVVVITVYSYEGMFLLACWQRDDWHIRHLQDEEMQLNISLTSAIFLNG